LPPSVSNAFGRFKALTEKKVAHPAEANPILPFDNAPHPLLMARGIARVGIRRKHSS